MKLSVPSCLLRQDDKSTSAAAATINNSLEVVNKLETLRLAVRCYCRALHGGTAAGDSGSCWSLWHQLGLAFAGLARLEAGQGHEARARRALEQALRLAPGQHLAWTSLGALACQLADWALAQHAFIKSVFSNKFIHTFFMVRYRYLPMYQTVDLQKTVCWTQYGNLNAVR